jgi:hypothetical protein
MLEIEPPRESRETPPTINPPTGAQNVGLEECREIEALLDSYD